MDFRRWVRPGNYNTQQHWVSHSDALFLVYTRRGANNDHVTRHRAPLFIARIDPESLQVIRSSEQILVPEFGARLGNFGVTEIQQKRDLGYRNRVDASQPQRDEDQRARWKGLRYPHGPRSQQSHMDC